MTLTEQQRQDDLVRRGCRCPLYQSADLAGGFAALLDHGYAYQRYYCVLCGPPDVALGAMLQEIQAYRPLMGR